jgi:hypothetical protein
MSRAKAAQRVAASNVAASLATLLSPARAAASRRNGAKSRGPKTPEGKARSARNALKHGLCAQRFVVLGDEDLAEFDALEAALTAELAPEGALQAVLARRIVAATWRLERAERLAAGTGLGPVPQPGGQEAELFAQNTSGTTSFGLAMIRDCNGRQGRVGERGPNPFPPWRARVRHAPALSRRHAGRALARPAHPQGAPGRAGGGTRRGRGGAWRGRSRNADQTQNSQDCWRISSCARACAGTCSPGRERTGAGPRSGLCIGPSPAGAATDRTQARHKSWRIGAVHGARDRQRRRGRPGRGAGSARPAQLALGSFRNPATAHAVFSSERQLALTPGPDTAKTAIAPREGPVA